MVEIVNIVATGNLNRNLDLNRLAQDLGVLEQKYIPEHHPGLHLRFEEDGPSLTLYRTGSYVIMGAKTLNTVEEIFSKLLDSFNELGIDIDSTQTSPTIKNIICKGDLGREVDLSALAVALKFENIEYEPEQSPFLYYWPSKYDCVISIPANGQVVVTGLRTKEEAEAAFNELRRQIDILLG